MANPLSFTIPPVDPHLELDRRLARAPREHAEALLVVYDLLQAAHDNGTLDTVHGLIVARDKIFGRLAEFAKTPEGETGLINLLEAARILSSLDPAILNHLSQSIGAASQQHRDETSPPSLWQLFKRVASEDGRRWLSFATLVVTNMGRSLKR